MTSHGPGSDQTRDVALADEVELALLIVLGTLAPAERLAFVLHEVFAIPDDDIASVVDRSPMAARRLVRRARRRVQGAPPMQRWRSQPTL